MNNKILSNNQVEEFHENGLLYLKSFYDVENDIIPIQKSIYGIIALIIKKYNLSIERESFQSDNFDCGFQELIKANRNYASEAYDAVKQIPAFIRLLADKKHERVFSQLFNTELPGIAAAGYGIRIDNPFEEKYLAPWHQEYLSQLRSLEGLVLWSPLLNICEELGPVEFCVGSQKEGVLPVRSSDPDNPDKSGAYGLRLVDEEKYISKYEIISPLTEIGDLVIMDWHLLHRSGQNTSQRSRWSMQMRYFNFDNEMGIKLGWCGSFSAGVNAKNIHPEYILD